VGEEEEFRGVIDLLRMKAILFDEGSLGADFHEEEIPEPLLKTAQAHRESLFEGLAELDDSFLEKYLAGEAIPLEEVQSLIRQGTLGAKLVPVLCGSAFKNKGIQQLLDAVVDYLPSPLDVPPIHGFNPENGLQEERSPANGLLFSAWRSKS